MTSETHTPMQGGLHQTLHQSRCFDDLLGALKELATAEHHYRTCHDLYGGRDIRTGRAWDAMRRAGGNARAAIAKAEGRS